jgi:hypothetical protein
MQTPSPPAVPLAGHLDPEDPEGQLDGGADAHSEQHRAHADDPAQEPPDPEHGGLEEPADQADRQPGPGRQRQHE